MRTADKRRTADARRRTAENMPTFNADAKRRIADAQRKKNTDAQHNNELTLNARTPDNMPTLTPQKIKKFIGLTVLKPSK